MTNGTELEGFDKLFPEQNGDNDTPITPSTKIASETDTSSAVSELKTLNEKNQNVPVDGSTQDEEPKTKTADKTGLPAFDKLFSEP